MCADAWLYCDQAERLIDVGLDTREVQRLAGGGEHSCAVWQQGSHSPAGCMRIVKNFDGESVSGERSGGPVDLLGSGGDGEHPLW